MPIDLCISGDLKKEPVVGEGSAFMLVRRTGDSRKEVGLRPGGMVMQVDLEIGSLAGDMSLYLAPPPPPAVDPTPTASPPPPCVT